jgi:hypothetical protein
MIAKNAQDSTDPVDWFDVGLMWPWDNGRPDDWQLPPPL